MKWEGAMGQRASVYLTKWVFHCAEVLDFAVLAKSTIQLAILEGNTLVNCDKEDCDLVAYHRMATKVKQKDKLIPMRRVVDKGAPRLEQEVGNPLNLVVESDLGSGGSLAPLKSLSEEVTVQDLEIEGPLRGDTCGDLLNDPSWPALQGELCLRLLANNPQHAGNAHGYSVAESVAVNPVFL